MIEVDKMRKNKARIMWSWRWGPPGSWKIFAACSYWRNLALHDRGKIVQLFLCTRGVGFLRFSEQIWKTQKYKISIIFRQLMLWTHPCVIPPPPKQTVISGPWLGLLEAWKVEFWKLILCFRGFVSWKTDPTKTIMHWRENIINSEWIWGEMVNRKYFLQNSNRMIDLKIDNPIILSKLIVIRGWGWRSLWGLNLLVDQLYKWGNFGGTGEQRFIYFYKFYWFINLFYKRPVIARNGNQILFCLFRPHPSINSTQQISGIGYQTKT